MFVASRTENLLVNVHCSRYRVVFVCSRSLSWHKMSQYTVHVCYCTTAIHYCTYISVDFLDWTLYSAYVHLFVCVHTFQCKQCYSDTVRMLITLSRRLIPQLVVIMPDHLLITNTICRQIPAAKYVRPTVSDWLLFWSGPWEGVMK